MKINKSIVLVLFLITLLALTVASQISQVTNAISIEEAKNCNTIFYNENQDVYGYVTRERNVYGNCLYYNNFTNCLNISGPNTACSIQQRVFNVSCITGKEAYQSYEVIGTEQVLKNTTNCYTKSFVVTVVKGPVTEIKEVDFLSWGICVNSTENGCLAITCGTLKGGSARNGIFNGCDGGKSCQKFLFCEDGTKVLYKASRNDFVQQDPTFHISPLAYKEVGK